MVSTRTMHVSLFTTFDSLFSFGKISPWFFSPLFSILIENFEEKHQKQEISSKTGTSGRIVPARGSWFSGKLGLRICSPVICQEASLKPRGSRSTCSWSASPPCMCGFSRIWHFVENILHFCFARFYFSTQKTKQLKISKKSIKNRRFCPKPELPGGIDWARGSWFSGKSRLPQRKVLRTASQPQRFAFNMFMGAMIFVHVSFHSILSLFGPIRLIFMCIGVFPSIEINKA